MGTPTPTPEGREMLKDPTLCFQTESPIVRVR